MPPPVNPRRRCPCCPPCRLPAIGQTVLVPGPDLPPRSAAVAAVRSRRSLLSHAALAPLTPGDAGFAACGACRCAADGAGSAQCWAACWRRWCLIVGGGAGAQLAARMACAAPLPPTQVAQVGDSAGEQSPAPPRTPLRPSWRRRAQSRRPPWRRRTGGDRRPAPGALNRRRSRRCRCDGGRDARHAPGRGGCHAGCLPHAGTTPAQPLPTPAGDLRAFWAEAEAAYQEGDWQNTLEFLTLVRRIDADYQRETASDQMLFESQVGLAAEAIAADDLEQALEHAAAAVALRPDAERVGRIRTALQALLAPGTWNISMARWTLATALGSYARDLLNAENPCAAADQLQAAVTLSPQTSSARLLAEAEATCAQARIASVQRELAQLHGRLLYSTQEGRCLSHLPHAGGAGRAVQPAADRQRRAAGAPAQRRAGRRAQHRRRRRRHCPV